ncbi:MAG: hypothetical protein ACRENL_09640 [Candidatus Dormibacteria bacterium]
MDDRGHRPAPANRAEDRDSASPPAMERHRDGPDQYRHSPGSAAAQWRAEGLDFVRDAIQLSYQ